MYRFMKKHLLVLVCLCCFGETLLAAVGLNSSIPADGDVNISIQSTIVLSFNENIKAGNGDFTLNGEKVTPRTIAGKYAIFAPSMDYFTDYTFVVGKGALTGSSGDSTDSFSIHFKTAPRPMPSGCQVSVATDGSGMYSSIQAAIDAAPSHSENRHVIYIYNGCYNENICIPADKKNITLWGEQMEQVVIQQGQADKATLDIEAPSCYLYNLSIRQSADKAESPALLVRGDKSVIRYCDISGSYRCLAIDFCRSYFYQCYVQGLSRLINNQGRAYFESCTLKSFESGAMVYAATPSGMDFGSVFSDCRLLSTATDVCLVQATDHRACVAFLQCEFPSALASNPWNEAGFSDKQFEEYMNFGPGAKKHEDSHYLTSEKASRYTVQKVLGSALDGSAEAWDPFWVLNNTGKKAATWIEGDGLGKNRGGNGGQEVTVGSAGELSRYISSNDSYIIRIKGSIDISGKALSVGSNTTLTGIDESSTIIGNIRLPESTKDVIIKYLNITHPGELKANDGISMEGAHRVWVHHVSFYDCSDGCCDMRNSTDSVTLSWNKFYYVRQTDGHRFTMICDGVIHRDAAGNTTGFGEPLHISLHHNWWSTMCDQRMPSSTNAHAHLFNCYWNCTGNYYCSLARDNTHFYSENNYYKGVRNPLYKGEFSSNKIYSSDNTFDQCSGSIYRNKDDISAPTYKYLPGATKDIPEIVTARAGNCQSDANYIPDALFDPASEPTDALCIFSTEKGFLLRWPQNIRSAKAEIYNLQGRCLWKAQAENETVLEIGHAQEKGVYILKISDDQNRKWIRTLVK